jgi:hypothetical protein
MELKVDLFRPYLFGLILFGLIRPLNLTFFRPKTNVPDVSQYYGYLLRCFSLYCVRFDLIRFDLLYSVFLYIRSKADTPNPNLILGT